MIYDNYLFLYLPVCVHVCNITTYLYCRPRRVPQYTFSSHIKSGPFAQIKVTVILCNLNCFISVYTAEMQDRVSVIFLICNVQCLY